MELFCILLEFSFLVQWHLLLGKKTTADPMSVLSELSILL